VCDLVDQSLAGSEPASLRTIDENLFHHQATGEAETLVPNSSGSGTPRDGTWPDEGSAGVARLSVSDVRMDVHDVSHAMSSLVDPDPVSGMRIPPRPGASNDNAPFDILNDGSLPYSQGDFAAFSDVSLPWAPAKEGSSFLNLENIGFGFVTASTSGTDAPASLGISGRPVEEDLNRATEATSKDATTSQSSLEFPRLQPEDNNVLWAEDFRHAIVGPKQYQSIFQFFQKQSPQCEFPSQRVLSNFVQLYYEYFDIDFPMVHPSTLDRGNDSWILILSMATIGSQYSQVSNGEQYAICLRELLLRIIARDVS
jgi:hypothetical protein